METILQELVSAIVIPLSDFGGAPLITLDEWRVKSSGGTLKDERGITIAPLADAISYTHGL
ncbi:hypothetical protein JCM14036_20940 [Desulfotomaculum defluvii]